jgi:hypothetical protein
MIFGQKTGEIDSDRRTLLRLGIDIYVPARLLYKSVNLAQAEACAFSRVFGRKERLENWGEYAGYGQAGAMVFCLSLA